MAIASVARFAFTAEHGISKMSEVITACVLVAVVASIQTGITRCAHLEREAASTFKVCSLELLSSQHKVVTTCLFVSHSVLHTSAERLRS